MSDFNWDENKIVVVENFIDQQNAEKIINYCENIINNIDEDKSNICRFTFPFAGIQDTNIQDIICELEKKVYIFIISEYFLDNNIKILERGWQRDLEIVRWNCSYLNDHRDGWTEKKVGHPSLHNIEYDISALIYLTDEYEGGELFFGDFDITVKPKKFSFVLFPSHYLHRVEEVFVKNSIARYTLPFFYTFRVSEYSKNFMLKDDPMLYEYKEQSLNKFLISMLKS
jgi:hypothetical protein